MMVSIKADLLWRWFVHNGALSQVGGRAKFTDCHRGVHVFCRRRIWRRRQVESVVVGVPHPSSAAGQDRESCQGENNRRQSSSHTHPTALRAETGEDTCSFTRSHHFGTFLSSGCLTRTKLHGRCFTDSVNWSRFSVAVRRFSIVSSILSSFALTSTCMSASNCLAWSKVFCSSARS